MNYKHLTIEESCSAGKLQKRMRFTAQKKSKPGFIKGRVEIFIFLMYNINGR